MAVKNTAQNAGANTAWSKTTRVSTPLTPGEGNHLRK
jgi:hypothetical protein